MRGYGPATIDEIIQVAGISRSTLYAHFRDTEDLLSHIASDYATALCAVTERLPGPVPSRAQIGIWVGEVAALIKRERIPSVLVVGLANTAGAPPCIHEIGVRLFEALAARLPAFQKVLAHRESLAMAWATVAMRELGLACLQYAQDEDDGPGGKLLTVAADLFALFVRECIRQEGK